MKPGAIKPRHALMGVALAGAILLVAFGDRTPADDIAGAVARPGAAAHPVALLVPTPARAAAAASAAVSAPAGAGEQAILALVPRATLIGDSDDRFQQGDNGAGPFAHQDWTPPPPPPAAPAPPPPPSAPPLPFTFIGKSVGDGAWEVYLARGERTYVVRDKGAVLDGTYRVESIAPPVLTLTYLPLNQQQQLNIGVFD
jgi:hypothetical protein